MFILITVRDTIHIPPSAFSSPFLTTLHTALHTKYSNRILPNHGLLITPHTILTPHHHTTLIQPPLHPHDAGAHLPLTFTLITFSPQPGQLLVGKVKAADSSGLLVALGGWFEWVVVAGGSGGGMVEGCVWDSAEGLWVWRYEGHDLYMDLEQPIRVKVLSVEYAKRVDPMLEAGGGGGGEGEVAGSGGGGGVGVGVKDCIANYRPAMRVNASIKEDGLGLLTWWD